MKSKDIHKLPAWARKQINEQINRDTRPRPKLEQNTQHEVQATTQAKKAVQTGHEGMYKLRVTHYRHRTIDMDNLHIKPFLDEIVASGLLPDDRAQDLSEISHRQIKVGKEEIERTVFEIIKVGG